MIQTIMVAADPGRDTLRDALIALAAIATGWAAALGAIRLLFLEQEKRLNPELLRAIRYWLKGRPAVGGDSWVAHFGQLFDGVFGTRHLSWHCFARSCIASVVAVFVLCLAWVGLHRDEAAQFIGSRMRLTVVAALVATMLVYSFPCDYFSLLKTRRLIAYLSARPGMPRLFAVLLMDFVLTCVVLGLGLLYLRQLYLPWFFRGDDLDAWFREFISWKGIVTTLNLHAWNGWGWLPHGVFFYSAFVASLWLWLYGTGLLGLRLLAKIGSLKNGIARVYDVDAHPLGAMGAAVSIFVTAAFGWMAIIVLQTVPTVSR
jgi:hypothetical protein